jgi:50S ribosomal protein L16 3-hydroxylase
VPITPLTHLGSLPVAQFMRRHWQRKPLLVRGALPDFKPPLGRAALFALAGRDDVEARLVTAFDGWRLLRGPIAARQIPPPGKRAWTLLVQGVNHYDDAAAALLERFRFVADARLDDLMVSYASDGGGVGPHIDAYDVFLLQAQGRRRWRIGKGDPRDLVPGLPLAILRRFRPQHEWVVEPGDLLYLPPGVAHEGTAVGGDCVTCSVGFRAPAWAELVEPWLDTLAGRVPPAGRYTDPGAPPVRNPGRLPPALIDAAFAALTRKPPSRADARRMLLTYLTEPKPNVVFERPALALRPAQLRGAARRCGVRLDRRTRMAYADGALAINGELCECEARDRRALHALADRRTLAPKEVGALGAKAWRTVAAWHAAGWLHLDTPPTR